MAFIDLDRLHFEVGKIALVHKEMQGRYEVTKIGIDADVVVECRFQMKNVVLIDLLVNVLNRHLRIEVFKELRVALLVMSYGSFS